MVLKANARGQRREIFLALRSRCDPRNCILLIVMQWLGFRYFYHGYCGWFIVLFALLGSTSPSPLIVLWISSVNNSLFSSIPAIVRSTCGGWDAFHRQIPHLTGSTYKIQPPFSAPFIPTSISPPSKPHLRDVPPLNPCDASIKLLLYTVITIFY